MLEFGALPPWGSGERSMITPDRLIVLIPAHNEAATVGAIVAQILSLIHI